MTSLERYATRLDLNLYTPPPMKLTREIIGTAIARHGFFNAQQLSHLGIKWPPPTGWINRLVGLDMPDENWQNILTLKNKPTKNQTPANQLNLFEPVPVSPVAFIHKVEIYFDGGCHGNPGLKYGSYQVLLDGNQIAGRNRVDFGHGTNNEAEFDALLMALDDLVAHCAKTGLDPSQSVLTVTTDSTILRNRLMVKNKIFKKYPRSAVMFELANRCFGVMKKFGSFEVVWKRREANVERFGH